MPSQTITTPITKRLNIKYPIFLAGMNVAAGPELAAAVTNAGGFGVIGGVGYTPKFLKKQIHKLKSSLNSPDAPFGVDLLLPQVGGGARKTNHDYTKGQLPELIDIIIEEGAKLFVSAVGVPPKYAVDKLHKAGILVMNMVGHPKHVDKALAAGADIICAQGGEGGGHTGNIPTSILVPKVVDKCRGRISPLTGEPVHVIGAGGIFDGRGLAMVLSLGAEAAWVGTRFVCSKEAGAPKMHKQAILQSTYGDSVRTLIFTGRPLRVLKNEYIMDWEDNRQKEISELTAKGIIPYTSDLQKMDKTDMGEVKKLFKYRPFLVGSCCACIDSIKPAKEIMEEMMEEAINVLQGINRRITSKL